MWKQNYTSVYVHLAYTAQHYPTQYGTAYNATNILVTLHSTFAVTGWFSTLHIHWLVLDTSHPLAGSLYFIPTDWFSVLHTHWLVIYTSHPLTGSQYVTPTDWFSILHAQSLTSQPQKVTSGRNTTHQLQVKAWLAVQKTTQSMANRNRFLKC